MGGHAFRSKGLYTPRLPHHIFETAFKRSQQQLLTLFGRVEHPVLAPEKADHGDVDIIVLTHAGLPVPTLEEIAQCLQAEHYDHIESNSVFKLAIPWPDSEKDQCSEGSADLADVDSDDSASDKQFLEDTKSSSALNPHIQVDITICTTLEAYEWCLFDNGHGDLSNIISSMMRRRGITITNRAMYLRIPEVESSNQKLARVRLTSDPDQVFKYLGMDSARAKAPFSTLNEMMDFVTTCRFYSPPTFKDKADNDAQYLAAVKASLNAYDNKALESRTVYAYWYKTYLTAHVDDKPGKFANLTRDEVRHDVFAFFGQSVKEQYERQKESSVVILRRSSLWSDIRSKLQQVEPDMSNQDLHDTSRALKRAILPSPGVTTDVSKVQKFYTDNDFPSVIAWAVQNHAEALANYRAYLVNSRVARPADTRKANPFSKHDLETYTAG